MDRNTFGQEAEFFDMEYLPCLDSPQGDSSLNASVSSSYAKPADTHLHRPETGERGKEGQRPVPLQPRAELGLSPATPTSRVEDSSLRKDEAVSYGHSPLRAFIRRYGMDWWRRYYK